jgi:phosphohistidine phosphatase
MIHFYGGAVMNLYLVQHAEAKPKEEDPDRSLSDTGLQSCRKVAIYASENLNLRLKSIKHSGKTRAEQTAAILGKRMNPAEPVTATDGLSPLDNPAVWAERLKNISDDIMLVGHLPHLGKLASLLLCGDSEKSIVAFRNAGIVCLQRDDSDHWSVRWILIPEVIGK